MSVLLMTQVGGGGTRYVVSRDSPTLPANIDAKARSLSARVVPVRLYELPNYLGRSITLTRAGGCNDLATCIAGAGNWRDRIRSVKFLPVGTVVEDGFELNEPIIE